MNTFDEINYVDGYIDHDADCLILEFNFNKSTASRLKLLNIPHEDIIIEIELNPFVHGTMRGIVPGAFNIGGIVYMTIDMTKRLIDRCTPRTSINWSCDYYIHSENIFKICSMYDDNNVEYLSECLKRRYTSMVDNAVRKINEGHMR